MPTAVPLRHLLTVSLRLVRRPSAALLLATWVFAAGPARAQEDVRVEGAGVGVSAPTTGPSAADAGVTAPSAAASSASADPARPAPTTGAHGLPPPATDGTGAHGLPPPVTDGTGPHGLPVLTPPGTGPHGLAPVRGPAVERPYDGGPVPPGFSVVRHKREGLLIAGEMLFTLSYLPVALVGLVELGACLTVRAWFAVRAMFGVGTPDTTWWPDFGRGFAFVVPVVGPLVAWPAGVPRWVSSSGELPWPVYAGLAAAQLTGIVLAVVGDMVPTLTLRQGSAMDPLPDNVRLVPAAPGAQAGVSLVGRF